MIDEEKRKYRCCFTENRPKKLKQSERAIRKVLERKVRQAIADGFTVFISRITDGMVAAD